jgi:benzoyl-CoA reductase/2-hydroxyglutaryl-CoA dehydratase subunit BcrC/BadD/HgdB
MIELLKLCGFEVNEIESELPRVKEVLNRIGITREDIERGKQRLNHYYDMDLQGVRKIFRVYLKELLDSVLAREEGKKKILWGGVGPGFEVIGVAIVSQSKEVCVVYPDHLCRTVLGLIFGKFAPILEAAEGKWLKGGKVAHCAEVKTRLGLLALGLFPKPDLMITSGCICDTNPKTHDLAQEIYGIPSYYYETCRDAESGNPYELKRAVELGARGLRRLTERLQEVVGFEITDDMIWEAMHARSKLSDAVGRVRDLVESSDPLPLSATHDVLVHYLGRRIMSVEELQKEPLDAVNTLYGELQERVNKGMGVVKKGAPRILALTPNSPSGPELEHLVGEMGMALVAAESSLYLPDGRRRPDMGELLDPYERMWSYLYGSTAASLRDRIGILLGACKRLHIDGVLGRYHVGCRTVAGDALIIKSAIEKELGLPVLLLEWEAFDPRVYNHEQYKKRFEVFKTMLRTRMES